VSAVSVEAGFDIALIESYGAQTVSEPASLRAGFNNFRDRSFGPGVRRDTDKPPFSRIDRIPLMTQEHLRSQIYDKHTEVVPFSTEERIREKVYP